MTPTSDNPFPIPIHEPINAGTDATGKEGIKESSGPEARETPRSSSSEEIWRVLEEASPQLRPLYQLMIFTGLRKGELAHLEWGDVDFGNKVLQVQTKGEWSPKSGEGRTIPLNQPSIDALRTAWEANERRKVRSNLVFPGRKGYLSDIRAGLNAACDRARVPRIHVHGLRHTFGSIMAVMEGVNPFAIKEAMGHKDIKTTMNYVSMAKPYIREQVEKLNAIPVPKTISPKFAQNNIIERRKKKKGTRIRPDSPVVSIWCRRGDSTDKAPAFSPSPFRPAPPRIGLRTINTPWTDLRGSGQADLVTKDPDTRNRMPGSETLAPLRDGRSGRRNLLP